MAALSGCIDFSSSLAQLNVLNSAEAWQGAGTVWTHVSNIKQHQEKCLIGLEAGLNADAPHAIAVASQMLNIFRETIAPAFIPISLIRRCFLLIQADTDKRQRLYGFDSWLNAFSEHEPIHALDALEVYLDFVKQTGVLLHDYQKNLTQLLTRLFSYAEELEELDRGLMLKRVVGIQDVLLGLGVNGVDEWLRAAERP